MSKHFKIVYGYNEGDYIPITENELPKAFALFLEGKGRGIFANGAVRGQDLIRISPDWHAVMGWNRGYKMQTEDYAEIKPLEIEYKSILSKAKEIAVYALEKDRRWLLSKPIEESVKLIGG